MRAEKIEMRQERDQLIIGDSPQLLVNLETQENYIVIAGKKRPYQREVTLSQDLLEGKRRNVLESAVNYYYDQACRIAEGMLIAESYRAKMNVENKRIMAERREEDIEDAD